MPYPLQSLSEQMLDFPIQGNIIDHTWNKFILRENGKVDFVAISMLSEFVYWYRPKIEKDLETNELHTSQRFKADLLQLSYAQLEERLGCTKRQLEDGFRTLERVGVAKRVLRNVIMGGTKFSNVLFISINPEKLKELRSLHLKKCETSHAKRETPSHAKRETYTETTSSTEITTKEKENKKESGAIAPAAEASPSAVSLFKFFKESREKYLPELKSSLSNKHIPALDQLLKNYSEEDIQQTILFAFQDQFWAAHVHTPTYLHRKFDKLIVASKKRIDNSRAILGGKVVTEYDNLW